MPALLLRPCLHAGCPRVATRGSRCDIHYRQAVQTYERGRGTAASQGYGYQWQQTRRRVLAQQPVCARCGAQSTDVDHIVAKRRGGSDDEGNLRGLCHPCHTGVTNRARSTR
jgi:5-methylcytosine-specific restriction protein A